MEGSEESMRILEQLRATRTSARERQSAMERTIRCVRVCVTEYVTVCVCVDGGSATRVGAVRGRAS